MTEGLTPAPAIRSGELDGQTAHAVFTFSAADTWADAVRRGMYMPADRLVESMIIDPRVERLLVVDPYRSAPIRLARHWLGQPDVAFPARSPEMALLRPLRLSRRDPNRRGAIERMGRAYDGRLQRAAERMGLHRPAVITCNPFIAGFSPLEWAGPVTFYAFDDWAKYPPHRRWWWAYELAYQRVARLGRRVCAVSQAIIEHVAPTGEWSVVPNGVAPEEWCAPWRVPPWFPALPAPRILYVGTLDSRLDTDAIVATARRFPHGSTVLVGPVTEPSAVEPLRNIDNLHIESPVGRAELAGLVHAADVCILPHRSTDLTVAMSPLKLYEYLAGGRPVVACDLPPVRTVDGRVVIVPPNGDFAEGVATALSLGPISEEERQSFIACNSWASRDRAILDLALHV